MKRLVVNGCSYLAGYARGLGHVDLADQLGIPTAVSLARTGSCNSRIIRTTLKDSYQVTEPTLYVVGLTFFGRDELPVADQVDPVEGRWVNIAYHSLPHIKYVPAWSSKDTDQHIDLKTKYEAYSLPDRFEDFVYRISSMINDVQSRGHQIVVFRQVEDIYTDLAAQIPFTKLLNCVNIINGLAWSSLDWQVAHGVKHEAVDAKLPVNIRHPLPGEHAVLNKFLVEYIRKNEIHLSIL